MAMPESNIIEIIVLPCFVENRNTKKAAIHAPKKVKNDKKYIPNKEDEEVIETPKTIKIAAAKEAPDEIPINPGSANGLRNSPCIAAPETEILLPTRIATKDLGNLLSKTINCLLNETSVEEIKFILYANTSITSWNEIE
jgi:hypothetical protein